jgi:hypothetical protein
MASDESDLKRTPTVSDLPPSEGGISRVSTSDLSYLLSAGCSHSMDCPTFMRRWARFKKLADSVVGESGAAGVSEFDVLNARMAAEWKAMTDRGLEDRAAAEGAVSGEELCQRFVERHTAQIEKLGYRLDAPMREALHKAFSRFLICDIGPAPFSLSAVLESERHDPHALVSTSQHCLQMATHWLRHPPSFLTVCDTRRPGRALG